MDNDNREDFLIKKTDPKVGFLLQQDAKYLATTAEATSEAASTTAEAAVSTAEAAVASTAEAASTTAEAASAATSSFLPQADKATANKAASNRDFFILKGLLAKKWFGIWANQQYANSL